MSIKIKLVLVFFLFTSLIPGDTITAKVVRVIDGDTIVVLNEKKQQIKVRLEGIDCPEINQDYGAQAKKVTSDICFGKQVVVVQTGVDRYNRVLGLVYDDDLCVNEELLRLGMAWHYKKYNQDPVLAQIEATAQKLKIGLWRSGLQMSPWEFRKGSLQ